MTFGRVGIFAALGALLVLAPNSGAHAQEADIGGVLDALLEEFDDGGPGALLGVYEGGELSTVRVVGMANLESAVPLTRESVLDFGSVAKQFTGMAVTLLELDGLLSVDHDVREYLPEIPDFGSTITIRHLLHHQSGLREIYTAKAMQGRQGGDALAQFDAMHMTSLMNELNFEPGTAFLYNNTAYMLLADLVARVSDMPFPDFMQERVFGPLGMSNTMIMDYPGKVIPGSAVGYTPATDARDATHIYDNSGAYGQGGIYGTIDDLAKWMANWSHGRVGGAAARERMLDVGVLADGEATTYGRGIRVGEERGLTVWAHTGGSAGFGTNFRYFPDHDTGVLIMSNRAGFPLSLAEDISGAVLGEHMEPREEEGPATPRPEADSLRLSESELDEYTGRYYSPELETMYTVAVVDGGLVMKHRRIVGLRITPIEADTFSGPVLGTLRFERNDFGQITGFRASNGRVLNMLFERLRD